MEYRRVIIQPDTEKRTESSHCSRLESSSDGIPILQCSITPVLLNSFPLRFLGSGWGGGQFFPKFLIQNFVPLLEPLILLRE
jgi:hypothetical protein